MTTILNMAYLGCEKLGGDFVPVVIVEMWAGRTDQQKSQLINGITKASGGIGVKA